MTHQQHTPGPWEVVDSEDGLPPCHYIQSHQGLYPTIAAVFPDAERGRANARLIAAAPELLEACEQAEYWLVEHKESDWRKVPVSPDEMLRVLRAAITKAKGGE